MSRDRTPLRTTPDPSLEPVYIVPACRCSKSLSPTSMPPNVSRRSDASGRQAVRAVETGRRCQSSGSRNPDVGIHA